MIAQLELFAETLPRKPYCTDDLSVGLKIRSMAHAIRHKYIQPNDPWSVAWLPIDVDRSGSAYDWYDLNCPPPNIITTNRANGHSHLLYSLELPVLTQKAGAKIGPYRYLAAIDAGLTTKLDADAGYVKLITKNPLRSDAWEVQILRQESYLLDELADWVDLPAFAAYDKRIRPPSVGYGRNCNLFDSTRQWAYRERHAQQGWFGADFFASAVLAYAEKINCQFPMPLPHSEVRATAKSIAKWTWTHITKSFEEWGAERRARSLAVRQNKADQKLYELLQAKQMNPTATIRELSELTGIPRNTVHRILSHL